MPIPAIVLWLIGLSSAAFISWLIWLFSDNEEEFISTIKQKFRNDAQKYFDDAANQIDAISTITLVDFLEILNSLKMKIDEDIQEYVDIYIKTFYSDAEDAKIIVKENSLGSELLKIVSDIEMKTKFSQILKDIISNENKAFFDSII